MPFVMNMEQRSSLLICVLLLVFIEMCDAANKSNIISRAEFLDALLGEYDNDIPPNYEHDKPCEVTVQLYINNFDSINEAGMDFTMGLIITQSWKDTRLEFFRLIDDRVLELDTKMINKVWVPDLFVANEKKAYFHEITVPNKMMHLYSNGLVEYKSRISLTAFCPMNLQRYPLDSQKCSLIIKSFSYSVSNVVFKWNVVGVEINPDITLPQFTLQSKDLSDCTENSGNTNFTCLRVDFNLRRMLGFYVLQIYIPTTLIVFASWISFWLSCDAVPARTSLGIVTVLTMTTQGSSAVSSLPKVSYIKAVDIWIAVCLTFVFSALIEFAFVNVFTRRAVLRPCEDRGTLQQRPKAKVKGCGSMGIPLYYRDPLGRIKADKLDEVARLLFPVAFTLFSLIYWIHYAL